MKWLAHALLLPFTFAWYVLYAGVILLAWGGALYTLLAAASWLLYGVSWL